MAHNWIKFTLAENGKDCFLKWDNIIAIYDSTDGVSCIEVDFAHMPAKHYYVKGTAASNLTKIKSKTSFDSD